jgi:hypothetical protein
MSDGVATVATMTEVSGSAPPAASRPVVPDGYGVPESAHGMLEWRDVESRLVASKCYWLGSVRPDGTPHAVPRWGVWVEGRFYYDGAPTTRHARNVENNPACTLTLESGTEVVIIEGQSHATRADADGLGQKLSAAFAKYHPEYAPEPGSWAGDDGGGLRVIVPARALAWFSFPSDCTRFTFRSV